jgi:hypothetical protein
MPAISSAQRNKIMAVLASGLVLGVGGTATIAAWVDTEWVYGGTGGDTPGVGTSTFVVEQNPSSPFTDELGSWIEEPDNPGSSLEFGPTDPLALTPGDVVYAPVALRTTAESIAGEVALQAAVAAAGIDVDDTGDLLFDALYLRVGYLEVIPTDDAPTCDAAGFVDYDVIIDGQGLDTPTSAGLEVQGIDAAGAAYLHYCFEISLDEDAGSELQGRTVAPAWQFVSESL